MAYKKRIVDSQIEFLLTASGAVLIEGPKWTGKTTTAKQFCKSFIVMDDPKNRVSNLNFARVAPEMILAGANPRLIDEWQVAPILWDAVRHEVDNRSKMGQFILTGSAVPTRSEEILHSGVGRIARLKMRTMSLLESDDSDGKISLRSLFLNKTVSPAINDLTIKKLAFLICRGGWPVAVNLEEKAALQQVKNYYDALIDYDINNVDETIRDIDKMRSLMKTLSRNISTQATISTLVEDLKNTDNLISDVTISKYLTILKSLHVIEDLSAWNPNLRSKVVVRTSPTRHFIDPSIATAALGISPNDLLTDFNTMGLFFESMCIRDLRVYADGLGGNVYHYRDKSGLECDAIIHLDNGQWGAIEIKLADHLIPDAIKSLNNLVSKIDDKKMNKPSFLMVLTGGNSSYRREDGIYVVSIGSLGI
ncbi:conserved hypothetical protein [Alteracholeplasma palmae J233]|uniref:ATPase n=1 Tax=Alteracholeplasma palmae (strain ATCC 49389 / J233) TaxID=1318466 RepID=U4KS36_ALTPJ|nr:DUF4143 domain-containing protein [Alteracholeplasma palmae]CCV64686.1 conserved hypothetical protein [Alteracholeplasma palmae J233]